MNYYLELAAKYGKAIRITHGFFREDANEGNLTVNDEFMSKRAEKLIRFAEQAFDKGIPVEISVAAEAFGKDGGWNTYNDRFIKVYGKNYLIRSFSVFYEEFVKLNENRKNNGLEPLVFGKDITLGYSDDYLEASKTKVQIVNQALARVEEAIQKKYGILIPIDTITEAHIHADPGNERGWDTVYALELLKNPGKVKNNLESLANAAQARGGKLILGEVDVSQNVPLFVRAGATGTLLQMILDINHDDPLNPPIPSITLWTALDLSKANPGFYLNTDYTNPGITYWLWLKILLENLQK